MQIPSVINNKLKHLIPLHFQINRTDEYKIIPFDPQQFWNWLIFNITYCVPPLHFRQHKVAYIIIIIIIIIIILLQLIFHSVAVVLTLVTNKNKYT